MGKYILQRLGMMVVVVLGISFIVFTIMNLTPGNPAQLILGGDGPIFSQCYISDGTLLHLTSDLFLQLLSMNKMWI